MGELERAVRADLGRWGAEVSGCALAAVAVDLAARLDDPETKANHAAPIARELRAALVDLARMAPEEEKADGLDELRKMRERRRGAS